MTERDYYLGFSAFPGIGPFKFGKLLEHFGSAQSAWESPDELLKPILGPITTQKFVAFRNTFSFEKYAEKLVEKVVEYITIADKEYPQLLKQISNPPFLLYVKGNVNPLSHSELDSESRKSAGSRIKSGTTNDKEIVADTSNPRNDGLTIAVVGTRRITRYGAEVTNLLTRDLVSYGFTIVSGLAMGVDAAAHKATIDAGGKTIAVLGCGVDCCYPSSNQKLYDEILEKGSVIISEFPLSMTPSPGSFPSRNRIIAGLSQAVLVTEGAADSGSLITAELAIKFNRKVFAIPGPITSSLSVGPYKLLKEGAELVSSAQEIVREMGGQAAKGTTSTTGIRSIKSDDPQEQRILDLLQNESIHFDELVRLLKKDSAEVGSLLTLMEMKGLIKSLDGGNYALV